MSATLKSILIELKIGQILIDLLNKINHEEVLDLMFSDPKYKQYCSERSNLKDFLNNHLSFYIPKNYAVLSSKMNFGYSINEFVEGAEGDQLPELLKSHDLMFSPDLIELYLEFLFTVYLPVKKGVSHFDNKPENLMFKYENGKLVCILVDLEGYSIESHPELYSDFNLERFL